MTANMKKFMEKVSADEALKKRAEELDRQVGKDTEKAKELITAFAAELGIVMTDEDFKADDAELSEDELETVAGGTICACALGGYGKREYEKWDDCICALSGVSDDCWCFAGGGGGDH